MDKIDAGELFAEAEIQAEQTVAVLRLVVSALLATSLLAVMVQLAPIDHIPVIWAMWLAGSVIAAYFGLGLVSFALARPRRYRSWMSWLFVTLDASLVVIGVAYSLVNFGSAANFTAIMPMIWLTPLVLGFGALRYNPALQGYVILLLIGGLVLGSLAVAPWTETPAPPSTGAFGVLFGISANIMRLVMVALAGLVLVIAIIRTRRLLARAIDETHRRARLIRYLPPQVSDWLSRTNVDEARKGRRQSVAVLFADIRRFTTRAEAMDPIELGVFVGEFRHCVTQAADTTGGVIDKFVGDNAMVVFGVLRPGPADAENALECAGKILENLERWNQTREAAGQDRVEVGIGVHWGDVFCGAVGDEARLEYTIMGDAVNVAARIEEEAKVTGFPLIVSKEVLEAAGKHPPETDWTPLEPKCLRGRHVETRLYGRP